MTTATHTTPQTVRFELEVSYMQFERPSHLPKTAIFAFDSFDKMTERYRKERRRRKLADRGTSAQYRMHLTAHGKASCEACEDTTNRHEDAINGKWFTM